MSEFFPIYIIYTLYVSFLLYISKGIYNHNVLFYGISTLFGPFKAKLNFKQL